MENAGSIREIEKLLERSPLEKELDDFAGIYSIGDVIKHGDAVLASSVVLDRWVETPNGGAGADDAGLSYLLFKLSTYYIREHIGGNSFSDLFYESFAVDLHGESYYIGRASPELMSIALNHRGYKTWKMQKILTK